MKGPLCHYTEYLLISVLYVCFWIPALLEVLWCEGNIAHLRTCKWFSRYGFHYIFEVLCHKRCGKYHICSHSKIRIFDNLFIANESPLLIMKPCNHHIGFITCLSKTVRIVLDFHCNKNGSAIGYLGTIFSSATSSFFSPHTHFMLLIIIVFCFYFPSCSFKAQACTKHCLYVP